jgi:shikimate kinase
VFRAYELDAARTVERRTRTVVSTGGGIVQTEAAINALKKTGIIVYIDRPLERLLEETETQGRPLLAEGRGALVALYQKRRALYETYADIIIKNDAGMESGVEQIMKKLEDYRNEAAGH